MLYNDSKTALERLLRQTAAYEPQAACGLYYDPRTLLHLLWQVVVVEVIDL